MRRTSVAAPQVLYSYFAHVSSAEALNVRAWHTDSGLKRLKQ